MAGSTISSTITETGTVGSATNTSPLTIAHSGLIDPATLVTNVIRADDLFLETVAGIGVLSTIAAPYLDNLGIILGGTAASLTEVRQSIGGYGVLFTFCVTLSNARTMTRTVTLGSASYALPLTVTGSGVIERSSSITTTIDFVVCNESYDGFAIIAGAQACLERQRAAFAA